MMLACPTPAPAAAPRSRPTSATACTAASAAATPDCRSWTRSTTWRCRVARVQQQVEAAPPPSGRRRLLSRQRFDGRRRCHPRPRARGRRPDRALRQQHRTDRQRSPADHPCRRLRDRSGRHRTTGGGAAAAGGGKKAKSASVKKAKEKASTGSSGASKATEEVFEPAPGVKIAPPEQQVGGECDPSVAGCSDNGKFEGTFFE